MGFCLQIDCGSLHDEIWGGIGPRTGYLSLFLDSRCENPKIIYHKNQGRRRPHPETPPLEWRRLDKRNPRAAIEIVPHAGPYVEWQSDQPYPETCFESLADIMPLTWGQAVTLLENLTGIKSPHRPSKFKVHAGPPREGEMFLWHSRPKAVAQNRSSKIATLLLLREARKQPSDKKTNSSDRAHFLNVLASAQTTRGTFIPLRPGKDISVRRVSLATPKNGSPETIGELRQLFSSTKLAWRKLLDQRDFQQERIRQELDWCRTASEFQPPAGVPNYDTNELARAVAVLEKDLAALLSTLKDAEENNDWFESVAPQLQDVFSTSYKNSKAPIPPHLHEIRNVLTTMGSPEFTYSLITNELFPVNDIDLTMEPLLGVGSFTFQSWQRLWHKSAVELALNDPTFLPETHQTVFMEWLRGKLASKQHQMGGLPDERWEVSPDFFALSQFLNPAQRNKHFATLDEWSQIEYQTLAPPFHNENVQLFELSSDDLLNWAWGDGYHLVVAIPREALRLNDFSQIGAAITN
ncbi:MAG: hypothetical protein JJ868_14750 [Shimia sp.]|uniref:hypothetical protein n=1 Tax=Shimia sp. TaxID=1954381 RepID=UPI001B0D486C|nr:hypothetical protein [Shimia sp.]MBO6898629.1 hypothetical protein [Shimia sp.]